MFPRIKPLVATIVAIAFQCTAVPVGALVLPSPTSLPLPVSTAPPDPNQGPVASFVFECDAWLCTFDASASTDPETEIASYAWTVEGHQRVSRAPTMDHLFAAPGQYEVTLVVRDEEGASDDASAWVMVGVQDSGSRAPMPSASASTTSIAPASDADGSGTVTSPQIEGAGLGTQSSGTGADAGATTARQGGTDSTRAATDDGPSQSAFPPLVILFFLVSTVVAAVVVYHWRHRGA